MKQWCFFNYGIDQKRAWFIQGTIKQTCPCINKSCEQKNI